MGESQMTKVGKSMNAINWYEFLCHTNYSFNTAASTPEEIIKQAEKLNYKSMVYVTTMVFMELFKHIRLRRI